MKRLILLIVALAVVTSLTACGATLKQNSRVEKFGGVSSVESEYETAPAHHSDWWVRNTHFGY